jgi:integrase
VRERIPDSADCNKREAAALERQIRARIEAEAEQSGEVKQRRAPTWGELAARWWLEHGQHLGWRDTVEGHIELLSEAIGDSTPIMSVTSDLLSEHVALWRMEIAPATVNRRLAVARSVLYRARDVWMLRQIPAIPWSKLMLEEPEPEPVYVPPEIRRAILARAEPFVRHTAAIALCHGLRKSSVLRLRWEWHDFKAGRFHTYGKSKRPGGKLIVLPITREYLRILKQIGIRDIGPVIIRDGAAADAGAVYRGWREAAKRAGYEGILFKDLRSSVALEILEATGSLDLAGATLAHSSPIVTRKHYSRFQVDHLRDALNARARAFGHKDRSQSQPSKRRKARNA